MSDYGISSNALINSNLNLYPPPQSGQPMRIPGGGVGNFNFAWVRWGFKPNLLIISSEINVLSFNMEVFQVLFCEQMAQEKGLQESHGR